MTMVEVRGINRIRKRLSSGAVVEIHYAWRGKGAPAFWRSDSGIREGSPQYLAALTAATPKGEAARGLFREVIHGFLLSQDFAALAPRTQSDLRKSINHPKNGIDQKFGSGPLGIFEDPRIRRTVLEWRDTIGGKTGDDRLRHLQRLLSWAIDRGMVRSNHLRDIASIYRSSRAEIFWTADEIAAFVAKAPPAVGRILIAACETGLRPGDLVNLSRQHIHPTPRGQRIVIWTRKRNRMASIPVTAAMAALIAATPQGQDRLLVNQSGAPYSHENYLGDAVSTWRDKIGLRRDLHLYDARGTAATRLLDAGADLKEISVHMGWSLKHAAEVIERYVALSPAMSDTLAAKLARAESRTKLQTKPQTGKGKK